MRPCSCKGFLIWRAGAYRDKNRLGHCSSPAFISFAFRFRKLFNWKDTQYAGSIQHGTRQAIWLVSLQLTYSYHTPLASSGHAFHMYYSFVYLARDHLLRLVSTCILYAHRSFMFLLCFGKQESLSLSLSMSQWVPFHIAMPLHQSRSGHSCAQESLQDQYHAFLYSHSHALPFSFGSLGFASCPCHVLKKISYFTTRKPLSACSYLLRTILKLTHDQHESFKNLFLAVLFFSSSSFR